jgi:hypothetical protein
MTSPQPILMPKVFNASEFVFVIGNNRVAEGKRMRGNQQIVTANWSPDFLKPRSNQTIDLVSRRFERQNLEGSKHRLELGRQLWRALLGGSITQFGSDDDAGTNFGFSDLADVLRDSALWVANEIRNDICVEQVAHQMSTGSGRKSSTYGKSSRSGLSVFRTASSDF